MIREYADTVGHYVRYVHLQLCKIISDHFVKLLYWFILWEFFIATSLPVFGIINLSNFSHPVGFIVVCYCDLNLHTLYYYWLVWVPMAQWVKNPPAVQETQETWVPSVGWEDPLEEEMATHSSILAWKISWTEEPGGLQSMGCKESDTTERLTLTNLSPIRKENHRGIFVGKA